jgi:hypothetical protein
MAIHTFKIDTGSPHTVRIEETHESAILTIDGEELYRRRWGLFDVINEEYKFTLDGTKCKFRVWHAGRLHDCLFYVEDERKL